MDLHVDRQSDVPAYVQIRNQLRERILRGDLAPGGLLPPEREMARLLGVSRTTVVSAYDELAAEGLVEGQVGRGTVVLGPPSAGLDDDSPARPIAWHAHLSGPGQRLLGPTASELLALRQLSARPGIISFASGLPDASLVPPERFRDAWTSILERVGSDAMAISPVQGIAPLRELIADRLAAKGIQAQPEHIVVVSGSQQGLDLLVRLLTEPGDTIVCESPTYFGALQAFQVHGLRVLGVPVDRHGMDVGQVESLLARYRPRFIYTIPNFQNPTGTTMSPARRERLLALAQRYQVPIVEDDPFSDLWFEEPPPQPIKSLDTCGHVLYLSTFSKSLAPGLRIGWLVTPRPLVSVAVLLKRIADLQPNSGGQHLIVEFARRGWLEESIAHARATYWTRCQALDAALRQHLGQQARWYRPRGGFFLWLELLGRATSDQLLAEASAERIAFMPGRVLFPGQGPRNACRLNFSAVRPPEIRRAIARLAQAHRRLLDREKEEPSPPAPVSAVV